MISLLVCLSFEASAQYSALRRGQTYTESDSAVAIDLPEYRKIRKKVMLADSLIAALKFEVNKNNELLGLNKEQNETIKFLAVRHENTIAEKDKTIRGLNRAFDELAALSKKFRIFRDPLPDTVTKLVLGAAIGWGVSKLSQWN